MCCEAGYGGYWYYDYGTGAYIFSGGDVGAASYNQFCVGQGNMPDAPDTISTATRQIEPTLQESMTIFPNPSSDIVNARIISKINKDATVRVMNLSGQVVWEQNQFLSEGEQQITIPLNELPVGFYLLQVNGEDGSTSVGKFNVLR